MGGLGGAVQVGVRCVSSTRSVATWAPPSPPPPSSGRASVRRWCSWGIGPPRSRPRCTSWRTTPSSRATAHSAEGSATPAAWREFKRRFGDSTPLLLGGAPIAADSLVARLLRSTVDTVTERGRSPGLRHRVPPGQLGAYKPTSSPRPVAKPGSRAGRGEQPEAAAVHYASEQRVDEGDLVAVYDLGGSVRRCCAGGPPRASRSWASRTASSAWAASTSTRPSSRTSAVPSATDRRPRRRRSGSHRGVDRLSREGIEAKEALSGDTETAIPVVLPGLQTEIPYQGRASRR